MKSSDLLRQLKRAGIQISRRGKGSHVILIRQDGDKFTFPEHGSNEIGKGLEKKIKKWAGLN